MQNYVLYYVSTDDEIYESCYSLLKYLDVYNLKPPADHSVVVYSNKPALLEAYGSYFSNFELNEINAGSDRETEKAGIIDIFNHYNGNVIYLPANAYPLKEFDALFAAANRGAIYKGAIQDVQPKTLPVMVFSTLQQDLNFILRSANAQDVSEFVEQYEDLKEFRQLLRNFFRRYQEESVPNQVKLMHSIDAAQIQEQKNKFRRLPLYKRLLQKMMGKGWDISRHAKM